LVLHRDFQPRPRRPGSLRLQMTASLHPNPLSPAFSLQCGAYQTPPCHPRQSHGYFASQVEGAGKVGISHQITGQLMGGSVFRRALDLRTSGDASVGSVGVDDLLRPKA
jgi:hypothetical protein